MRKSETEDVKRFTASKMDKYRPPYGKNVIAIPRTSVFAATTNAEQYLNDPTGARRFWPIRCGEIDLDGLRRERDQLFAEAVARYRAGERWWLEGAVEIALAQGETAERDDLDGWHDVVAAYANSFAALGAPVAMGAIFMGALGIPYSAQDRGKTGRIATILSKEGFKRVRVSRGGPWFYVKK